MSSTSDVVAVGLDLRPKTLISAYSQGIFPWPSPGLPLLWYCPDPRAVLDFSRFHFPKRLRQKIQSQTQWTYSIDQSFSEVIETCAEKRSESGTWITPEMIKAYLDLHQLGLAHSFEVWNENHELIGGVYGVDIGGYFAAESMFFHEADASKAALTFLIAHLKKFDRTYIDIQAQSEHLKRLGAIEISRKNFLKRLQAQQTPEWKATHANPFENLQAHYLAKDWLFYLDEKVTT